MKENQKDSKSQSDQKSQQLNQNGKSNQDSQKPKNPSSKNTIDDEKNEEGTKMPGHETRTPVAGQKSTTQEKNQSGNNGK